GTIVVPGHGYISDEHEVVEYRDMVAIVRDRVQAWLKKGATLDQVKAASPPADYDTRYGATTGQWTTDMFVEAVYRDLSRPPFVAAAAAQQPGPGRGLAEPDTPDIKATIERLKTPAGPQWNNAVHFWCEEPRANRPDDPVI